MQYGTIALKALKTEVPGGRCGESISWIQRPVHWNAGRRNPLPTRLRGALERGTRGWFHDLRPDAYLYSRRYRKLYAALLRRMHQKGPGYL